MGGDNIVRTMPTVARTGDGDEQVTPLELFFDLVFVFAMTYRHTEELPA
jgi:low temperature requirement protein LtrA